MDERRAMIATIRSQSVFFTPKMCQRVLDIVVTAAPAAAADAPGGVGVNISLDALSDQVVAEIHAYVLVEANRAV